jgi:hypothetical protein
VEHRKNLKLAAAFNAWAACNSFFTQGRDIASGDKTIMKVYDRANPSSIFSEMESPTSTGLHWIHVNTTQCPISCVIARSGVISHLFSRKVKVVEMQD